MVDIETFRKIAMSFPDAEELPHFEKASFRLKKKIFATLDVKNNRACLMLTPIDQSVFVQCDSTMFYPVPNKWGLKGATFADLSKVSKNLLKDAMKHAYNKLVTQK